MNKKYKSRYGAISDITAAQYLVEFIMERAAKKDKTTLPFKFWNIPKWNKAFRMQIKYANDLLKDYTEEEIFAALRTKKGERVYSLGAKKTIIIPLIEEVKAKRQEILNRAPSKERIQKLMEKLPDRTEEWLDDKYDMQFDDMNKQVINKETSLWSKLG